MAHSTRHIMILGAGYAGLAATGQLGNLRDARVTLVDQNPYHTLETELHEAAAHAKDVTLPLEPLIEHSRAWLYPARVTRVDLDSRTVETDAGNLEYDLLLVALGSTTNFFRIPGLSDHATELKTGEDGERIYEWMLRAYHPDFDGSRDILIGGAGLTGVELAAELAVRAQKLSRERGVKTGRIHLVEAGTHILPALEEPQRRDAARTLELRGVEIHTNTRVTQAEAGRLQLENGSSLTGGLIVWTGGVRALDIVHGTKLERGEGNRIAVNHALEVTGYENVFAAGDMALSRDASGKTLPTTAQHAAQQGKQVGRNIRARLEQRTLKPYRPSIVGEFTSLGGLLAVGWVKLGWGARIRLAGHLAGLMKRASEWRYLWSIQGPKL
jgi:NADH:ubiquinone reductase (H+-translocating)